MKIGIIGLPLSGKSTVFNVLAGANVETKSHAGGKAAFHIGTIKVPDERLEKLAPLYNPKKITPIEITFVDSAAPVAAKEGHKKILDISHVKEADALAHVVRFFEDESIPHPEGSVNADRDVALVELELIMSDLEAVNHRLDKIEKEMKAGQKENQKEYELLLRSKKTLEYETPLRDFEFTTKEDEKLVRGFQFLSQKPMMILANVSEDKLTRPLAPEFQKLAQTKKLSVVSFCAKVEMEIDQMQPQDRAEFFKMEGIQEPARERFVTEAFKMLDTISFFTGNENELKQWALKKGTTALGAAGKVHSDIERGFIRAEVINAADLVVCGSLKAAKEKGLLRLEGKDYNVNDGDVINFRFNV
ncbi:MAG: redox-regulated ATPase YchF [Candidatus Omnitrophota bacterium]